MSCRDGTYIVMRHSVADNLRVPVPVPQSTVKSVLAPLYTRKWLPVLQPCRIYKTSAAAITQACLQP